MCAEPNAGPPPEAQAIGHIGQRAHGGVLTCGLSREGSAHSQGRMRMRAFNGADKRADLFSSVMQSASLVASMVFGRLGESGAATDGARNSARSEVDSSQPVPRVSGRRDLAPTFPAGRGRRDSPMLAAHSSGRHPCFWWSCGRQKQGENPAWCGSPCDRIGLGLNGRTGPREGTARPEQPDGVCAMPPWRQSSLGA